LGAWDDYHFSEGKAGYSGPGSKSSLGAKNGLKIVARVIGQPKHWDLEPGQALVGPNGVTNFRLQGTRAKGVVTNYHFI